jgi:hypothetical protein
MSRKKARVERDLKTTVRDLTEDRSKILTDFANAYCVEKGFLPSQIKLVEKQEYGHVSWFFMPKPPDVPAWKRAVLKLRFWGRK